MTKEEINQPLWALVILIIVLVVLLARFPAVEETVKTIGSVVAGALAMYINPKGEKP